MDQSKFNDLRLFSVPDLWGSDSDPSARARYLLRAEAIAEIFSAEGISTEDLRSRYSADPEKFELRMGDLTADGCEFARLEFQLWLGGTDRWKRTNESVSKYSKALRSQWEKYLSRSRGIK